MFQKKQTLIHIPVNGISVEGVLCVPDENINLLVIFVHGSGSSRKSPREKYVTDFLNKNKISTLLFDLLTEKEDAVYENRFNIPLLSNRIRTVTKWIKNQKELKDFDIAYFGASTGAAAAIEAATDESLDIKAVVSRGGRPDLAEDFLSKIKSPVLLIVGGNDSAVINLNKSALEKIQSIKKLEIVPGATHLFEEPGALKKVSELARDWFVDNISRKEVNSHEKL